jgi:ornithine cyclodeaminase
VRAVIDGAAITRWKTVADSLLGARFLAPPAPRRLLVMGAGVIAATLARAYPAFFPSLESVAIWNRSPARAAELARELAAEGLDAMAVTAPEAAAATADIVAAATMSETPVLHGAWLKPGTHVDLIGAYTKTMREADDALMARARLFVDCRETVVDHLGELLIPLAAGVVTPADVLGDLYDLVAGASGRMSPEEVTLFKNGGGAHLDLMTAMHVAEVIDGAAI